MHRTNGVVQLFWPHLITSQWIKFTQSFVLSQEFQKMLAHYRKTQFLGLRNVYIYTYIHFFSHLHSFVSN